MLHKTSILVQNLKCGGCANTITSKLLAIENISDVRVDIEENRVFFSYLNDMEAIMVKEKLKTLGYPSIEVANSLTSKAKSFVSCATGNLAK